MNDIDIVTGIVQTTLKTKEEEITHKIEKIRQLQKEIVEGGKISPNSKQDLEKDDIWRMQAGVRKKYFADKFFEKQI